MRAASKICVAVILFLFPPFVFSCSRFFPTYQVGSDLVVVVNLDKKPLDGIEVWIGKEVHTPEFHFETAFWDRTDKEGKIRAHGLVKGRYLLTTRHADVEGGEAAELEVSASPEAKSELTFHWPAHQIFSLRQITGTLVADRDPRTPLTRTVPLANASVLLIDAISAQQLGATVTNDHGFFQFPSSVEPGLYILRLSEQGLGHKDRDDLIQGFIFVEVDGKATTAELPKMSLMMSTCGLTAFSDKDHMVIF